MEMSQQLVETGLGLMRQTINDIKKGQKFSGKTIDGLADKIILELSDTHSQSGQFTPPACPSAEDYSIYHTLNVTAYSVMMAARSGIKGEALREIAIGALLHDIGKINTPDHLRWKQEGNDPYETEMISEHPKFGAHWISSLVPLPDNVMRIIGEHHERFDGKGYPEGLAETAISQAAKIVSICNMYDYLTFDLPGKPALAPRDAMHAILRQSGIKFSQKLIGSFLSTMTPILLDGPLYQLTSLVLLDTKEIAAVMKVDSWGDISPEIVILTDSSQKKLTRPLSISLKKDSSRKILKVLKSG
ncbi:MAG: HD-GYP domain-containing protein [Spirochaetota bacterium]